MSRDAYEKLESQETSWHPANSQITRAFQELASCNAEYGDPIHI